jgi:4-aminobutyrate aminotransferase/(S)-3-amino-2-methylpropionate transaminase
VLDVIEDEGLCERATALGEAMRARMEGWQQRWPQIGDVRGLGAMIAIELVVDPETREPAPDLATQVVDEAARNGLLLLKSGIYSNCIRVLTPLVLADVELDEALGVWEQALEHALGG